MVFPASFNLSLNFAIRSSWSEPQSASSHLFADYIELLAYPRNSLKKKTKDCLDRFRKNLWQNPTAIHGKNSATRNSLEGPLPEKGLYMGASGGRQRPGGGHLSPLLSRNPEDRPARRCTAGLQLLHGQTLTTGIQWTQSRMWETHDPVSLVDKSQGA